MSKKHFIALADALRETKPEGGTEKAVQWQKDVDAIIGFCKSQNSQFDATIFRGYLNGECGPSGGKIK